MQRLALYGVTFVLVIGLSSALRSQQPPAPTQDRVGFPEGYERTYQVLYTFDRPDNGQVRVILANAAGAAITPGEPVPYGAIYVMETWRALRDSQNRVALDTNGRFQKEALTGIFVMRKEPGFGAEYGENRNGEWEYVAYRPDRSYLNPPNTTGNCAICHLQAGKPKDYVFRASLFFNKASGALPTNVMQHYAFLPGSNTVSRGSTFTWYNDDETNHRIRAADGSFLSPEMPQGASFEYTFAQKGQFDYICTIHPAMRGTVFVDPAVLQISNSANAARNPAFQVGDGWVLQLSNATPNAPVFLRITKDGADLGVSGPYGPRTDAQGRWSFSGTPTTNEVGSWSIQAVVGSQTSTDRSPAITFSVSR